MKHLFRLAIKFISCLVVLGIILGMFYDFSFRDVLLTSAVLGVLSYVIGDLFILRTTNNMVALASDFVLTFLVVWLMGRQLTFEDDLFSASLISAAAVTVFEYFFHRLLTNEKNQQTNKQDNTLNHRQFQTETSEELTPVRPDVRNSDETND